VRTMLKKQMLSQWLNIYCIVVRESSRKTVRQYQGNVSLKIIVLVFLILTCIGITYYFHWIQAKDIVFTHFFYVPVVLAAFWWGLRGIGVGALLGAFLMASHFLSGLDTPYWEDLLRSVMFLAAGLAVGILRRQIIHSEENLRETRDYLDSLIGCANAPVIVWNPASRITLFNHAFEHLTGYTAEEVIGKELGMLFPEANRDESLSKIKRALNGEHWESVEIPILCKDGDVRLVLWNSANIYAKDDSTLLATIAQGTDVTERKKAQEEVLSKERQLAHTSRLSTLGEMATAMAHELNQPLTIISMAAESILRDIKKNRIDMSLLPQDIEDILHNVRRIDTIITHMRTFARQPGEIKLVEPEQILNNTFIIVGEQLRVHNISVSRHIQEALPPIKVDPNQLEQVFINILANARQTLDEKGKEAERAGESFHKQMKCSILQEGDYVVFEFADNGCGVPDDIKPRIFEPFFTTKEPGQGTGLGLSIAYGIIVRSHKGRIWVEDNEMGGATFKVALPIEENATINISGAEI
jgi:PAS domain S-box-containing protein